MPKTVGIVLAGGESRRFGAPKCIAELEGVPLIQRVLDAQRPAVEIACIVANEPGLFGSYGTEIIPDRMPGCGPAGGVHAGLVWAHQLGATGIWCSPCDAPFLDSALGKVLIGHSAGADAVLPASDGPLGYEPLFGWYSVGLRGLFEERLLQGAAAMHEIIESVPSPIYVAANELADAGCGPNIFSNINTKDDLVTARRKSGR